MPATRCARAWRGTLLVLLAIGSPRLSHAAVSTPAAPVAPSPAAATFADSVAALIPDTTVTVDILTPGYSKRMQELSQRLLMAARANPAWFESYTQSHRQPLPWHPNLGLRRTEYEEYLAGSKASGYVVRQRANVSSAGTSDAQPGGC